MRRQMVMFFTALLLASATISLAAESRILVARDIAERPVSGVRFAYQGVTSPPTTQTGMTKLHLPSDHRAGQQIQIQLVPGANQSEDWFLVNSLINIPSGLAPVEVVLMRRSSFRQLAAEARDASRLALGEPTAEERRRILVEAAARYGITADQLETALRSFAETQDPKDRGIAAYLEGKHLEAEALLNKAAEKREDDFVEILKYLGVSQYEQAKYRASAESFQTAVALRAEEAVLLRWLGIAFYALADWAEAEPLMRRALAINEEALGAEHPQVAADLNSLAWLLVATNRLAEAEPLMRRALAIDEKIFGAEHPIVAGDLNALAQLLQGTTRLPIIDGRLEFTDNQIATKAQRAQRDQEQITTIVFLSDKSEIIGSESTKLDDVALNLKSNPELHVRIIGQGDNQEAAELKGRLKKFAEAVRHYLVNRHGIDGGRLHLEVAPNSKRNTSVTGEQTIVIEVFSLDAKGLVGGVATGCCHSQSHYSGGRNSSVMDSSISVWDLPIACSSRR